MLYYVIIALNSAGKRNVGDVISLLEKKELELIGTRKKVTPPGRRVLTNMSYLILQYHLNKTKAMMYYRGHLSSDVLKEKLDHFNGNHVELFFESGELSINPDELWNCIFEDVFDQGKKLPIMFVFTEEENNIRKSFAHDKIELEKSRNINPWTLIPLGKNQ